MSNIKKYLHELDDSIQTLLSDYEHWHQISSVVDECIQTTMNDYLTFISEYEADFNELPLKINENNAD
jgi:hypothetical protein